MKEKSHRLLFESKVQFFLFLAFWLCYFIINIITTQFFKNLSFQKELLLQSLSYTLSGFILSLTAYLIIKRIKMKIRSYLILLLISTLTLYLSSLIWAISHHLTWWLISGEGVFVFEIKVYPMKALLFSTIMLASILMLIISEIRNLSILKGDTGKDFDVRDIGKKVFESKETDYNETLFLSSRKEISKIRVDSIKLIRANDYYSNIISDTSNKSILSKYSLRKWELILPPKHFLRIHRSCIVNLNYVEDIRKLENNTYEVTINGLDQKVNMSRRFSKTILEKFRP